MLPDQLQPKLNVTTVGDRSNSAAGRTANVAIGQAEVRVIGDVEELRPKLQIHSLGQAIVLGHAEIEILITWAVQDVAWGVPLRAHGRLRERAHVEPTIRRRALQLAVADAVRILGDERPGVMHTLRRDREGKA